MNKIYNASGDGATARYRYPKRVLMSIALISLTISMPTTASDSSLTLSSAIQRTIDKNPSLKVFEFRDTSLQSAAEVARLLPAYEVGVEAENFGGSGELSGTDGAEITVALSSVIELGGKRSARINIASERRTLLDAAKQVRSLELLGEVTRRYGEVLAAQLQVSLTLEASGLANDALNSVTARSQAGATTDAEVKRAKAAVAQAALAHSSAQRQLDYRKIALAALWGQSNPDFSRVEGNLFQFGTDVDFKVLYTRLQDNPAVQIFAAEERVKDAQVRLAKTHSRSDISWSVGVRQMNDSDDTALVAGFSLPLFTSKRNASIVSAAIAERDELLVEKDIALLNLHAQLFRAFHNRKQAITTSNALQDTIIPALEQALEGTKIAYERGRYGYLEYVSARQELLSARRMLIEAATAALLYGAEIEQLTAEPLSASQYEIETNFEDNINE